MINLSYNEYLLKALILPIAVLLVGIVSIIVSLVCLSVQHKTANKYNWKPIIRVVLALPWALVLSISFAFVVLCGSVLEYGANIIWDDAGDRISIVGKIEEIKELSVSPLYTDAEGTRCKGALVTIKNKQLYFMNTDDLKIGDYVQVSYLPKSSMVLSYDLTQPDTLQLDNNNYKSSDFDGIMVLELLCGILVLACACIISQSARRNQHCCENEIRQNYRTLKKKLLFSCLIGAIGFGLSYVSSFRQLRYMAVLFALGAIIYSWLSYKNVKLVYDEKEIAVGSMLGQTWNIALSDIISIELTQETKHLSQNIVDIFIIRYKTTQSPTVAIKSLKYYSKQYEGVDRFIQHMRNR